MFLQKPTDEQQRLIKHLPDLASGMALFPEIELMTCPALQGKTGLPQKAGG